jgi:hypothetical protein
MAEEMDDARRRLERHRERLEQSRRLAPLVAVARRFVEIDGSTRGQLVSIQLFTTVIPQIIAPVRTVVDLQTAAPDAPDAREP